MEDVTNHINNIGKPLEDRKITLSVSFNELERIKLSLEAEILDGHDSTILMNTHADVKRIYEEWQRFSK